MNWLGRKLDSLIGTLFAASFALAASQLLEFIQQYRQRLGGHLVEAQYAFRQTIDGDLPGFNAAARQALATPQQERITELAQAANALTSAGPWELPWKFLWHIDFAVAGGTLKDYQPAMPLDLVSVSYAAAGMVLGWMLWELIKSLVRPSRRHTTTLARSG
jgi:hypothetical protein